MPVHPTHLTARGRPVRLLAAVLAALALVVGLAVPASALLTGVDVASYQHPNNAPIDWNQVKGAGHSFAFVKATEGVTYTNPWFARDWAGAGAVGLYRGAYHYARPDKSDGVAQARYFVSVTGTMPGPADLPPVLDLEETGGLGPSALANWARDFLGEVTRLTGRKPILYTGYYFWRDSVGAPADIAANHRLWLPSYPADPNSTTFRPLIPTGWSTWTFWQYTSTGTVPGIAAPSDVNRYCCDAGSLAGLTGDGVGAGNPFGNLQSLVRIPGAATIAGWSIDPDTTGPVNLHVYVDGQWVAQVSANVDRPDVGSAFPGFGNRHGFAATIPVGAGARQLCAYAINTGAGNSNPLLGCASLVADPIGNYESATVDADGVVRVGGWALDPDAPQPLAIHFYVDGQWGGAVATDVPRPDVQQAFPGSGPTQGFSGGWTGLAPGPHTVCAYAINIGAGTTNPLLGCRTVTVPPVNPVGDINGAAPGLGSIRLTGWALDFDTSAPLTVHAYLDGAWAGSYAADTSRPDVGAFLAVSPNHGFDITLASPSGRHTACLYGINVGRGTTNSLLGCRAVIVPANPTGSIDSVSRSGNIATMSGWAIDPDTAAPIDLHFYVDGQWGGMATASLDRPDVGWVFPAYGGNHGYAASFFLAPGPHQICAYAINVGSGSHVLLGCRTT